MVIERTFPGFGNNYCLCSIVTCEFRGCCSSVVVAKRSSGKCYCLGKYTWNLGPWLVITNRTPWVIRNMTWSYKKESYICDWNNSLTAFCACMNLLDRIRCGKLRLSFSSDFPWLGQGLWPKPEVWLSVGSSQLSPGLHPVWVLPTWSL